MLTYEERQELKQIAHKLSTVRQDFYDSWRKMQEDPVNLNNVFEHMANLTNSLDDTIIAYSDLIDKITHYSDIMDGSQK